MNMNLISRFARPAAVAATLSLAPGLALAGLSVGDSMGKTETEIRASLEKQGYTVNEIEIEDGMVEAEVALNGKEYEIEVDPKTGTVVEIELEDEEEDKDD